MRAVFCESDSNFTKGHEVIISGDRAHHLQVVRVKLNEDILVLNGKGALFYATITAITKKEFVLKINKVENCQLKHELSLAVSVPKKDAFEDILRISVELGINEIYPLSSEFSQYEFSASDRIARLLESALVQSNNAFLPKIHPQTKLASFLAENVNPLVYFSSISSQHEKSHEFTNRKLTILIGPEGGFSTPEEIEIANSSKIKIIHLPTPILRAPTAVATSVGYLLGLNS